MGCPIVRMYSRGLEKDIPELSQLRAGFMLLDMKLSSYNCRTLSLVAWPN